MAQEFDAVETAKQTAYRYRGETVALGAAVEWIIDKLYAEFVHSTGSSTDRQWKALKQHLHDRRLSADLQREMSAIAAYFKARNLAAHSYLIVAVVGSNTQIIRVHKRGSKDHIAIVTMDDLASDAAIARAGYESIQAVARSLDDHQPAVLTGMNAIKKGLLLGR